jgi:hypothetical protein
VFSNELPILDRQWLTRLANAHNYEIPELWRLLNYYEGQQPLSYMHPELLATMDDRVRQLVINWPRQVVDALEERIDLDGFRLGGQSAIDEDLDHIWQYNDLNAGYQQAHVTSMVGKRAYVIVGANPNPADADFPIITVESPLEVHAELDPATRRVVAARKAWTDRQLDNTIRYFQTLYPPSPSPTPLTALDGAKSPATSTAWARCPWCRSSTAPSSGHHSERRS